MANLLSPFVGSEQKNRVEADDVDSAASQNFLRNVRLICGREYKNQVTRRSFIATSIIYLLVIIIGSFIPTIIQYITAHTTTAQIHVVVINRAGSVADMSSAPLLQYMKIALNGQTKQPTGENAAANFIVTLVAASDLKETQKEVKNGQVNVLLVMDREADQEIGFTYYTTSSDPADSDAVKIETMVSQLNVMDKAHQYHLSPALTSNLFAAPRLTITDLQQGQDSRSTADWVTGLILAYIGIILIFITNQLYGVGVAQGVAEEKGNRIMELLMLATTPFQLMAGKIIGIGAAGLTQITGLVIVSIGMLAIQRPIHAALLGNTSGGLAINITGASITMLLLVLLYSILAFALYSSLYAAAGALVERQEEAQSSSAPVTLLFIIGYIVSISIVSIPTLPDATWFKVMSYIPFWTPTTMLVRVAVGTVAWWEPLVTAGLMILTIPVCTWLSARIYRYGILSYGQRFSLRQLIKVVGAE